MSLGTMKTRMLTDLDRGSSAELTSRLQAAIADAILHYRARRFGFNQKRSTTSITSSTGEYLSLPDDWLEVDRLRLETSSSDRDVLTERGFDWIEDQQDRPTSTGRPAAFAIQNRSLRLYPPPDGNYTLHMSYLYDLPEISHSASDAATNAWMTEAEALIRMHAMRDVLVSYVRGAEAVAEAAALSPLIDRELAALERRASREQGTGRVRPWM